MKVPPTLFISIIVFSCCLLLPFQCYADVVPPEIPEDRIYILNLLGVDNIRTYTPLSIRIDIYNPDSSDHHYKVAIYLLCKGGDLLRETREGYVRSESMATVFITLFPASSGSAIFQLHLWQDWIHVERDRRTVVIEESSWEQSIEDLKKTVEDLSSEIESLRTALEDSNAEIGDLRTDLDDSKTNTEKLQMQLNTMYYVVIGGFALLTFGIVVSSVLLYRRISSVKA